jgi:hypothetical protein
MIKSADTDRPVPTKTLKNASVKVIRRNVEGEIRELTEVLVLNGIQIALRVSVGQ